MTAATTAAAAAMDTVLPKLAALLQEEDDGKLNRGRQDIVFLRDELQQMHDSLVAAAKSQGDRYVEECSRELRDLSHDIDDSIDGFVRLTGRKPGKKPRHGFGRLAVKVTDLTRTMLRHWFAEQLQLRGFRSRIEALPHWKSGGGGSTVSADLAPGPGQ
ncbi:hypothetical protein BAE44_0005690 [Dichanthelium oligosanthes]|uniref:Disease resistance N-terminal domain-containing protein n=1 Tax=Dichanthelium oligosanthes TaxID=888268 RepID=A0A1E5W7B2_9POAL|nr:hypothetical protein BAE44_0005690 [Dichanthelium oligosanthes]